MANGFCGPFAIGYALGVSPDKAAALVRDVTGKRAVFGVHTDVLEEILTAMIAERWTWPRPASVVANLPAPEYFTTARGGSGWRNCRHKRGPETRPTFAQFGANFAGLTSLFIVATRDHYLVLDGPRVYDNNGTGLLGEHHASNRRLEHAYRINRK